jgi:catalase
MFRVSRAEHVEWRRHNKFDYVTTVCVEACQDLVNNMIARQIARSYEYPGYAVHFFTLFNAKSRNSGQETLLAFASTSD